MRNAFGFRSRVRGRVFHIEKQTDGKTTDVILSPLEGDAVTAEIARMLGAASEQDQTALRHAREMLQRAHAK